MSSAGQYTHAVGTTSSRIAFLMPVGGSGGVQRVMTNLANGLRRQGLDPVIWCCDVGEGLPGLEGGIEVIDLGMRRLRGDYKVLAAAPTIRRLLKQHQPTILLAAPGFSGQMCVLASRDLSTRTVVMVDNRLSTLRTSSLKHKVFFLSACRTYGHADCVVAAHDAALQDLHEVLPADHAARLTRIYHPIVADDIDAKMLDEVHFERSEGVPAIVAAGRLVPEKGYATLLQAFALVRARRACTLVILGDGPLWDELHQQTRELDVERDVQFAGMVDNVFAYFAHCDLFVLSSEREAFGNVLVEALAAGLPCVATQCESGGPQEILAQGSYGVLVPRHDPAAMADAMMATLDRRTVSVEDARERGRQFSVTSSARHYAQLFRELAT